MKTQDGFHTFFRRVLWLMAMDGLYTENAWSKFFAWLHAPTQVPAPKFVPDELSELPTKWFEARIQGELNFNSLI